MIHFSVSPAVTLGSEGYAVKKTKWVVMIQVMIQGNVSKVSRMYLESSESVLIWLLNVPSLG